jgi:hypothetical protein
VIGGEITNISFPWFSDGNKAADILIAVLFGAMSVEANRAALFADGSLPSLFRSPPPLSLAPLKQAALHARRTTPLHNTVHPPTQPQQVPEHYLKKEKKQVTMPRRTSKGATAGSKRTRSTGGTDGGNTPRSSAKTTSTWSTKPYKAEKEEEKEGVASTSVVVHPPHAPSTTVELVYRSSAVVERRMQTFIESSSSCSTEDEADTLQRFSNISTHPPRRSHNVLHDSPPQLSTTPPPSPPRMAGDLHDEPTQLGVAPSCRRSEYAATESGFYARVSPPASCADTAVTSITVASKPSVSPPPSLLSELLLAEAERAGATAEAAAAAAATVGLATTGADPFLSTVAGNAIDGVYAPTQLPFPALHSMTSIDNHGSNSDTVTPHQRRRRASPSLSPTDTLGPLAVCIGVVPLPGRTNTDTTSSHGKREMLPWVRALHAAASSASSSVTNTTSSAGAEATTTAGRREHGAFDENNLEPAEENVRVLHPRCLLTRREAATTPTMTRDVVGWSGLFPNLRLVLHGAQTPSPSTASPTEKSELVAGQHGSSSDAQVCRGAATVTLMLA